MEVRPSGHLVASRQESAATNTPECKIKTASYKRRHAVPIGKTIASFMRGITDNQNFEPLPRMKPAHRVENDDPKGTPNTPKLATAGTN